MPDETDPAARTLAGVKAIYQQVDDLKRLLGRYFQDPTQSGAEHRPIPFSVYRANRDQSKGVALRIEPKSDDRGRCLFAEMAAQKTPMGKGSATFDWPEALRVSLGRPDVSQIVAYIDRQLKNNNDKYNSYDLYHDSSKYAGKKQNAIVSIGWSQQGNGPETLRLQISRQSAGQCRRMAVNMAYHEAYELRLLLCDWLVARCNWSGRSVVGGAETPVS